MFKKNKPQVVHTLMKCRICFADIDGNLHIGETFKYFDAEATNCSIYGWLFEDVQDEGYLLDTETLDAYPLMQVKKYWLEELGTIDIYPTEYKIWYSNQEVEERQVK